MVVDLIMCVMQQIKPVDKNTGRLIITTAQILSTFTSC